MARVGPQPSETVGRRKSCVVEGLAVAAKEELSESAAPLAAALLPEPALREESAVREAVDWWLESLPASGRRLAPELEAPGGALLRAFARGRLASCGRGERLLGEGEEVRHYIIVLSGSCRLRCRAPGGPPRGTKVGRDDERPEEEDGLAAALDEDGALLVGHVRRGEAVGLVPGEPRSPWEVVAGERVVLLLLGAEDYAASLRPYHRQLQADAALFLGERGVCPQAAGAAALQRFAGQLRQRRLKRGQVLYAAGELQRQIFILREGSVALLSPPQERPAGEADKEPDEDFEAEERFAQDEDTELEIQRRERLRQYSMEGGAKQLQGAADEARNDALKQHARGALGKTLRGEKHAKPRANLGVAARKDGLVPTAIVSEPGSILGEEVLLYESLRELAVARSCYTAVANEDCLCLVVDLLSFQKLGSLVGPELLLEKTREKLNRHASQHVRCKRSALRMTKECRRFKQRELQKQERQTLRLPPSYGGAMPLEALESTDDWLGTVLSYRKAPRNEKMPGTLNCLTTLALDPLTFQTGPGVGAMLQVFNNPKELQSMRDGLRHRKIGGTRLDADRNPMGELVQRDARYSEASPPSATQALPPPEPPEELDGGLGGVFFCTEVEEAVVSLPSDRSPGRGGSGGSSPQAAKRSSSVPVLPRINSMQSCGPSTAIETALPADLRRTLSMGRSGSSSGIKPSASRKGGGSTREALVAKTFYRAVVGKSVLVLTDKAETRRCVMKGLQSALKEFDLVFVKTTTDLWTRLNSSKDTYHALIVDLCKTELQADALVKTVRQHQRYSRLPILVLSAERELSDAVRTSCSFVVFHPVAAPVLREGLLWCLDKKALEKGSRSEMGSGRASPDRGRAPEESTQVNFALLAQAAPIAVA